MTLYLPRSARQIGTAEAIAACAATASADQRIDLALLREEQLKPGMHLLTKPFSMEVFEPDNAWQPPDNST